VLSSGFAGSRNEKQIADDLSECLKSDGHEIDIALDDETGNTIIDRKRIDLVLLAIKDFTHLDMVIDMVKSIRKMNPFIPLAGLNENSVKRTEKNIIKA